MFQKIGYAHCYMYHFHKDMFCPTPTEIQEGNLLEVCVDQRLRVEELIKSFAENRKTNVHSRNIAWFQEQIFIFEEEIDNMC